MAMQLSTIDTNEDAMGKSSPARELGSAITTNTVSRKFLEFLQPIMGCLVLPPCCLFFFGGSMVEGFDGWEIHHS